MARNRARKRNPAFADVAFAILGTAALGVSGWALYRAAKNKPFLPGSQPAVKGSARIDVKQIEGGMVLSGTGLQQIDPTTYEIVVPLPSEVLLTTETGHFSGWSIDGGTYNRRRDNELSFTMNQDGAIDFDVEQDLVKTRFRLLVRSPD